MNNASVRWPENFRIAKVMGAQNITPLMRRITVKVDDLARFDCPLQALGPHVHALIPREDLDRQEWPVANEIGHAVYPPPERRPAIRTYSVRRFLHAENCMDIDFVLHGDDGVASRWAVRATTGEEIGLWRPHARILDVEPERYVLLADHTGLPAIAFILDHLPQDALGDVFIEVPNAAEEQPLRLPPGMRLKWLHAGQNISSGTGLVHAIRDLGVDIVARSFVWAGAEASIARGIRNFVRKECRLPAHHTYILNYWKRGMVEGTYDHGE